MTVKGTGGLKTINVKTSGLKALKPSYTTAETALKTINVKTSGLKALKPSYTTAETALKTIYSGYKLDVYRDTSLLLSQPNTIIGLVNKALSDTSISNDFFHASVISNRWFSDNSIANDVLNLRPGKNLLDVFSSSDAVDMSVVKTLSNTAVSEDTIHISTSKLFVDSFYQEDFINFVSNKTLTDSAGFSDKFYVNLSTHYTDISSAVDHFYASLASNRYFENNTRALDAMSLQPNKVAADIQSFSENSWFDLLSSKVDITIATDTLSVSAKNYKNDTTASVDIFAITSNKPFENAVAASDSAVLNPNKVTHELQTAFDQIDTAISKTLSDSVDTLDKFSADFTKPDIASLTFVADTFAKSTAFVRNFRDKVTTLDYPDLPGYGYLKDAPKVRDTVEYLIAFIREFNETQQVLDLFAAHFAKPFSDSVGSYDSFSKVVLYSRLSTELVSASENLYVGFYKNLHDAALIDEHIAMSVATQMQDLVSPTDDITVTASKVLTETSITKDSIKFENKTPQSESVISSSRADLVLNNYYTSDYSSYSYVGVQTTISN